VKLDRTYERIAALLPAADPVSEWVSILRWIILLPYGSIRNAELSPRATRPLSVPAVWFFILFAANGRSVVNPM